MVFFTLSLILLTIFLIIWIFFFVVLTIALGAPFDITHRKTLEKMIEFSGLDKGKKGKKSEKVADLGSGDGRIVIEFAKLPNVREAHGYEINPFFVWFSRRKIRKLGFQDKAFIHFGNFWKKNLSDYDVITVFQIGFVMKPLKEKLKKELKKGSKIISNTWRFPDWRPKKSFRGVYLYEV